MRHASASRFGLLTLVGAGALGLVVSFGQIPMMSSVASAQSATPGAQAILHTATGDQVAQATFTDMDGAVALSINAVNLPAGFHGLHVHANGACDAPDFTSAGPHFDNPARMSSDAQGGMPQGHSGDLPSLLANQNGTAQLQTESDRFSVADLLAGAGTALIIHAGPDNFANIPTRYAPAPDAMTLATGDAGARLACGVIQAADASAGQAQ
jgi:Cu-Zn family superoxide dismutase